MILTVYSMRPWAEKEQIDRTIIEAQPNAKMQEEVRVMVQTVSDTLVPEGRLWGLKQALLDLLADRFGDLPAAVEKRIDGADDLNRLREAICQAPRLDKLDDLTL